MSKAIQKKSKKRANEINIWIKKPDRRLTRQYVKQKKFESLVNPENQTIPDFVLLNKKTMFDLIESKVLDGIQVLGIKGFTCLLFSIVLNLLFVASIV